MHPREFGDPTTPQQIYRQVREYHDKYPDKALVVWHAGAGQIAALMGGAAQVLTQNPTAGHGQGRVVDKTLFDRFVSRHLADKLMEMQPVDNLVGNSKENWALSDNKMENILIYSLSASTINFVKAFDFKSYKAIWYNPGTGNEVEATLLKNKISSMTKPDDKDWLLFISKIQD
jgi:hypothetical protein